MKLTQLNEFQSCTVYLAELLQRRRHSVDEMGQISFLHKPCRDLFFSSLMQSSLHGEQEEKGGNIRICNPSPLPDHSDTFLST